MKVSKIVKCSASWCSPCRVFGKTFHNIENRDEFKDIDFKSYDIEKDDEGQRIATQHNVKSIPTTILFDENDNVIYKIIGNVSEQDFANAIRNASKLDEEK